MKRSLDELSNNVSALGSAGLELARAEAAALGNDLKLSGRSLLRVLLLGLVCLFLLFWIVAVLVVVAIEVGSLWLPRWGAALAVLGLMLLLTLTLGGIAWRRWRRLESPAATARRRFEDHADWWRRKIIERDG